MSRKTAAVCLVMKGPLVLGVTRGSNRFDIGLPGGKQEPGETPENCAIRELFEETGIVALDPDLLSIDHDEFGYLVYTFQVNKWKGQLRSSHEGKAVWVEPKELIQTGCTFKKANKKNLKKAGLL